MPKESERQNAEQRRRRTRTLTIVIVIVIVVAALVVVLLVAVTRPKASNHAADTRASHQVLPAASSGAPTTQAPVTRVANVTGIPGVLAWDTTGWPGDGAAHPGALEHDHVTGPVTYSVLPPVGGPHNPIWMNAGVYTKPVPNERAVHNLEHGAVWITYNPNLPAADVKKLTAFVSKQSLIAEPANEVGFTGQANRYIDLSPWRTNSLPSPIVISAWGYQLRLTSPTDPRLQAFVDTFRANQKYSPEVGGPVDGVPTGSGGVAAVDGGSTANPPGTVN